MKNSRFAFAAALAVHFAGANAAAFPEKAITLVTPFPAGSTSDLIPRLLSPLVAKSLGVPVIVENRAGANGSLGASAVARAAPDGHTLLMATTGVLAINQWIYGKLPYSPEKDFAPIVHAASTPNVIVVGPGSRATTLSELVEQARAKPGDTSYASAGSGSSSHLCGELLKSVAHIQMVHVPYKGPAPAMQDVLGGTVPMMCDNLSNVLPYVQSGQLKALAITSTERSSVLPNVPTSAEAGYPNLQAGIWYGFVAPAGTPQPVLAKLNATLAEALNDPAVRARLEGLGLTVIAGKPETFKAFIGQEAARMKRVVAISGATAD